MANYLSVIRQLYRDQFGHARWAGNCYVNLDLEMLRAIVQVRNLGSGSYNPLNALLTVRVHRMVTS